MDGYRSASRSDTISSISLCSCICFSPQVFYNNWVTMSSVSEDVKTTASQKRAYIFMPKLLIDRLEENYQLEHGLIIKELNPCLNEGYLQVYFKEWGSITGCKVWRNPGEKKSMAYMRFATSDEADRADWAGPHVIGGTEVLVRRVVSPKTDDHADLELNVKASSARPQPRRSISLGYILEDAQWLDDIVD